MKRKVKSNRGRKQRKLNLNFGRPFTVKDVVNRYKNTKFENGNKGITAVAVYQRLMKMIKEKTAKFVKDKDSGKRGRPAKTFVLVG